MKLTTTLMALLFSVVALAQKKIVVTQNVPYDEYQSCVMDIARPAA